MATRKKREIHRALTPAHLAAIGQVAASWANLEFAVMVAISTITSINIKTIISLTSPCNFAAWLDILERVTQDSPEHEWRLEQFKPLRKLLMTANLERNKIVHGSWVAFKREDSPGSVMGFGLPKRGRKTVIPIIYTAKEMRTVAVLIEKVEKALDLWSEKQRPSHPKQLANALLAMTKPDPKTPTQKAPRKPSPP